MFPAALTTSQLSALRSNSYVGRVRVLASPRVVVFQAQVQVTPAGVSYAALQYHNVTVGSASAVLENMTVLVGSLIDAPVFIGRVRKPPTAAVLFVNETSAAVVAGMTIWVVSERRLWPRLQRVERSTLQRFKDFDVPFRQLAPTISGLQSVYVVPANTGIAFAPTARAHVPAATISSWQWQIGDGTFVVGSATSQNVTLSFPAGHRWIRLRVTDSGGRSEFIDVEVYAGDLSPYTIPARSVQVSCDGETGWRATVEAIGTTVEEGRRVCVVVDSPTTITSNVALVGQVARVERTAEAQQGARFSERVEVSGFPALLATMAQPGISAIDTATPIQWGEIAQLDIVRALVYALQWHTNLQQLCSIEFSPLLDGYRYLDYSMEAEATLDAWRACLAQVKGAFAWAGAGGWRFTRDANHLSAADRAALVTVCQLTESDALAVDATETPQRQAAQVLAGFGAYTSSTQAVRVYQAKAPTEAVLPSGELETLNSQLLLADQTDAQSRAEASQRVADALAAMNEQRAWTLTLGDPWWFLSPQPDRWVELALTDRARPTALQVRGVIDELSWQADGETSRISVQALLRGETVGGSSMTVVALTPSIAELENPVLPSIPDYPFDAPSANLNYAAPPTRRSRQAIGAPDVGFIQPIEPQAAPRPRRLGCRTITLLPTDAVQKKSGFTLVNGERYTITVSGNGLVQAAAPARWVTDWDYTVSPHGAASSIFTPSTWVLGEGWWPNTADGAMWLLTPTTTTPVNMTYFEYTFSAPVSDGRVDVLETPPVISSIYKFTSGLSIWAQNTSEPMRRLRVRVNSVPGGVFLRRLRIFTDAEPTWGATFVPAGGEIEADAFYRDIDSPSVVAWAGTGGLFINSAPALPAPPQPLNPTHEYTFTRIGAGAQLDLAYVVPNRSLARAVPFFVQICGLGAGE